MGSIRVSEKYSIFENGKLSKKKFLDALALLKADIEFLENEVKKAEFVSVGATTKGEER